MQIFVFSFLIVLGMQLPAQYKGWTNDCSLYFSDQSYQNLDQNFLYCKIQVCDDYIFSACNHKSAYRSMNLSECMNLCCSKNSQYESFSNILHFLDQCETDYFKEVNEKMHNQNKVLYIVLGVLFGGIALAAFIIFGCCYYEQILRRFRQRYFGGRGETPAFEMRFLRR